MNNQEKTDNKIQPIGPAKLDKVTDEKYIEAMREQTGALAAKNRDADYIDKGTDFGNANDGVSSLDEEGVMEQGADNVSPGERKDLERAATSMPNEQDDMADFSSLDDSDFDGTPLNEKEDMMGEDLDISAAEEESNIYDDNDD